MDGADIRKILYAFEDICHMPEHVFDLLRRAVSGFRERAEGGHIGEAPAIEAPKVNGARDAFHDVAGSLHNVGGDLEARGKIVRAAGRDIAERAVCAGLQQPLDHLVERSVAANGYDKISLVRMSAGELRAVSALSCHVSGGHIAIIGKQAEQVGQVAVRLLDPCTWVHDK